MKLISDLFRVVSCQRVRGGQPARRSLRQRAAPAQPREVEDSGAGAARHQALRHQQAAQVRGEYIIFSFLHQSDFLFL